MKFEEYVPLAMRTNRNKDTQANLINACLGLVGEHAEYLEAETRDHKLEELGDIHWYIALLQSTGEYVKYIKKPEKKSMYSVIGRISDNVKKHVYQGHALNEEEMGENIIMLLVAVKEECKKNGVTQSYIMEKNVAKLKARFPNGFEVEKSVNRKG